MLVYCSVQDCIHNNDGLCENVDEKGREAIYLDETLSGEAICSDIKYPDEYD